MACLIQRLNKKITGFILGSALVLGTICFDPNLKEDEKKLDLENHIKTILPETLQELEQEFGIRFHRKPRIEAIDLRDLYPDNPDALGARDPFSNTIYLDINKTSYPCTSPFLRFIRQGNDKGKIDAKKVLRHELGHEYLDIIYEQQGKGSWPNFRGLSKKEAIITQMLSEGFARCFETGMNVTSDYKKAEEPNKLSDLKTEQQKLRFTYEGGHRFVYYLIKEYGTQGAIDYILRSIEKPK
jgi:hypothetical protein